MSATKKEKRQGQMETLKKVFHYMKHYIPILILSIVLATVTVALTLYFPILPEKQSIGFLKKGRLILRGFYHLQRKAF